MQKNINDASLIRNSMFLFSNFPRVIQDITYIPSAIFKNTQSLAGRFPLTITYHCSAIFLFPDDQVSKDGNPTALNTLRDPLSISTIVWNLGTPFAPDSKETIDFLHLLGQVSRYICRISFQATAKFLGIDATEASRASNIIFDSIAVIATDLSKTSQKLSKNLYYLYENIVVTGKENQWAADYVWKSLTKDYMLNLVPIVMFRSKVLDVAGELKKQALGSPLIKFIDSSVNDGVKFIISWGSGLSAETFDFNDNIYIQANKTLSATNNTYISYPTIAALGLYKTAYLVLPDLFITSPVMLAIAKIVTDFGYKNIKTVNAYKAIAAGDVSVAKTEILVAATIFASMYQKEISSYLASKTPELASAAIILLDNDVYNNIALYGPAFLILLPTLDAVDYVYNSMENYWSSAYMGENNQSIDTISD